MNSKREILDFYRTHSPYTNPGKYSYLFDPLPSDKAALREVIAGIRINFISDQVVLGYKAAPERLNELEARTMEKMLEGIMVMCDKDLFFGRPVEKRLVGTCRDAALFMCAILRHKNIPARIRYGLAPSQLSYTQMIIDHSLCEYWDEDRSKWIPVETEITQKHLDTHHNKLNVNLEELQYPIFEHAGSAIAEMLKGNWSRYLFLDQGLWYYRNIYFRDIAFLNKEEVNIWDHWGMMLEEPKEISERTLSILKELSEGEQCSIEFTKKAREIYQREKGLQVPQKVICKCPYHKEKKEIFSHPI